MVQIFATTAKGAPAVRYFPYSGYLGLTPVRVDGIAKTNQEDDARPVRAKQLTISLRCYESRTGKVNSPGTSILVDYSQTLWSKAPHLEYEDLTDLSVPFHFELPEKTAGQTTAHYPDLRIHWRIEMVLHHMPLAGVGDKLVKHYELPLVRYDSPSRQQFSRACLPPSEPILYSDPNKSKSPIFFYTAPAPATAIGPLDPISVPITVRSVDPHMVVRNVSAYVERRIHVHDSLISSRSHSSPIPLDHEPIASCSSPSSSSSTPLLSDANGKELLRSDFFGLPLLHSRIQPPAKTFSHIIVEPENYGLFTRCEDASWAKTVSFVWPTNPSQSRWANGETMDTGSVCVKFYLRLKLTVHSPTTGTDTIDLAEQELFIVAVNNVERANALARYIDAKASQPAQLRSKSKSPRRSKHAIDSPPSLPSPTSERSRRPPKRAAGTALPARRPHTSAGPRDKPSGFQHISVDAKDVLRNHAPLQTLDNLTPDDIAKSRMGTSVVVAAATTKQVEWDKELLKVEVQHRRSSMGFGLLRRAAHKIGVGVQAI